MHEEHITEELRELFAGTRGSRQPRVLFIAESYGAEEEKRGEPLVGTSGKELSKILSEVGLNEEECLFSNVINERPPNNDMKRFFYTNEEVKKRNLIPTRGLYPKPNVEAGVERLRELIRVTQPEIIFGMGNYVLWALTTDSFNVSNSKGYKVPTGIINWRGSQLREMYEGIPFVPIIHPAAALRKWEWRYNIRDDIRTRMGRLRDWDEQPYNFIPEPTRQDFDEFFDAINEGLAEGPTYVSVDIETRYYHIACIGFALDTETAICVPLMRDSKHEPHYWNVEDELHVIERMRDVLIHPHVRIIGQNFLFDAQYLWRYWAVKPVISYDTRILQSVIYPGTPADLVYLSSMFCKHHRFWKEDSKNWDPKIGERQFWEYNCRDCVKTFEVFLTQRKLVEHYRQTEQYKLQRRRLHMYLDMMLRGVRRNDRDAAELTQQLMEAAMEYDATFYNLMPPDVYQQDPKLKPWWRSPQQQAEIFYNRLGVKEIRNRDTGALTVDDEALTKIGEREPLLRWLCNMLAEYRSVNKFGDAVAAKVGFDGRLRCSYSPTTETYRCSSSKDAFGLGMNLQNLSKGHTLEDEE